MAQHHYIQIGVVGAMQRAHPRLSKLWLQWTGIVGADKATFDLFRPSSREAPGTKIDFYRSRYGRKPMFDGLCDFLGVPEDGPERRQMPIWIQPRAMYHAAFWEKLKQREAQEYEGPLEWWWQLMVIRYRSAQMASRALIRATIGEDDLLDKGIVSFRNPTYSPGEKNPLPEGSYCQPTHLEVSFRVKKTSKHDAISVPLDETFKPKLLGVLIDLSTRSEG
jgi:hypothetical protein